MNSLFGDETMLSFEGNLTYDSSIATKCGISKAGHYSINGNDPKFLDAGDTVEMRNNDILEQIE